MGTTRAAAGSAKAFERIDRDYVLAAAKAALQQDAGTRAQQRVVYCSSSGSNSKAPFLYMKSKGLTEEGLGECGVPPPPPPRVPCSLSSFPVC